MSVIQYGTQSIEYQVAFASRKTLAIHVHPDLSVTVRAPEGTVIDAIQRKVYGRAAWILKQQRQFQRYLPDVPPRQYVSGESHRFLGRQYRLKVGEATADAVNLTRQSLCVAAVDKRPLYVRGLVEKWYRAQAQEIFRERLQACQAKLSRFGVPLPVLSIKKLASSWGHCTATGAITLNIKLIQVPIEFIDYVLIHELCHLKYLHHGPAFYKLLSRALPDWVEKRDKLNSFDFG